MANAKLIGFLWNECFQTKMVTLWRDHCIISLFLFSNQNISRIWHLRLVCINFWQTLNKSYLSFNHHHFFISGQSSRVEARAAGFFDGLIEDQQRSDPRLQLGKMIILATRKKGSCKFLSLIIVISCQQCTDLPSIVRVRAACPPVWAQRMQFHIPWFVQVKLGQCRFQSISYLATSELPHQRQLINQQNSTLLAANTSATPIWYIMTTEKCSHYKLFIFFFLSE